MVDPAKRSHEDAIDRANNEINGKKDNIRKSPYRLNYHFMAPTGWINDPNGFVQYNAQYHLFYQYNPYSSNWGQIHWGHAISKDLVEWEHLPVALAPSEQYDNCGCFSGSAVVHNDTLYLFYTGFVDGKIPRQVQCMAFSKDGFCFKKNNKNPIIGGFPAEGSYDFRDPKVWKHNDQWYMVVGTSKDGIGKIALYSSSDLEDWRYLGIAAESEYNQEDMWECPDLFSLQDTHALIVSPLYGNESGRPMCFIGDMDYENVLFTQLECSTLDYGSDFYAPQTMMDSRGRRIMIAWMDNWSAKMPSKKYGWAGAMTIPRQLVLENKSNLKQKPIPELVQLRSHYKKEGPLEVEGVATINDNQEIASEIIIVFNMNLSSASEFGIQLRASEDGKEKTEILFDITKREVIVDREKSGCGDGGISSAPFGLNKDNIITIRMYMDTTSLEIFINDGEQVITNRIYPEVSSRKFNIFAREGKIHINQIESWKINSIW